MSCWGAAVGEEYSMVFYLLGRDRLGGDVYVYAGRYGLYIYISDSARVLGMVGLLRIR